MPQGLTQFRFLIPALCVAIVSLAAGALFPSGSENILPGGLGALDKIASILRVSNRRLVLEGHTDSLPSKSLKVRSTWDLAAARSTMIVRYLIAKHNVPANRLVAVAYADQKPVATNDTEAGQAQNRRVEIAIYANQTARKP